MSSALGVALGMTSTYTWAQVVSKIKGVATKTSGSQSVTTSSKWGFSLNDGAWLYIPTNGYYTTSHWLNIPWNTIKSSLGTANTGNVLSGYTFTSQNGIKLSGAMANRSSTIQTATTSTSDQSKSCYRINGSNIEIIPAKGWWGSWDWTKSCIRVPIASVGSPSAISYGRYDWTGNQNGNHKFSCSVGIYCVISCGDTGKGRNTLSVSGGSIASNWYNYPNNANYMEVWVVRMSTSGTITINADYEGWNPDYYAVIKTT